jgi:hypothetical protein
VTALILKAHFDGMHLTVGEPHGLPPGAPITVTVLSTPDALESSGWSQAASGGLTRAYSDDEPDTRLGTTSHERRGRGGRTPAAGEWRYQEPPGDRHAKNAAI